MSVEGWQELDAYIAVGHAYAKDLDDGLKNHEAELKVEILRSLVPRLPEAAREYFSRALVHRAWLFQHPDGVAFSLSFQTGVTRNPLGEGLYLEPTDRDYQIESIYQAGEFPPPAKPKTKTKKKTRARKP
jgi:hypothetical protein